MLTGLQQRPMIHASVPDLVTFWNSGFAASRAVMTYVVERGMSSVEFLAVAKSQAPLYDHVRNEVSIFSRSGWQAMFSAYGNKKLSMTDSQRLALFRHDVAGMEGMFPAMVQLAESDKERLKSWYGHAQFLYCKRLAVEQLLRGLCYLYHPQASEKGIMVKSRVEMERCFSMQAFDPAKTAFKNLISNGIKYGRTNGKLEIWNEGLNLFFRDDGIGMHRNFAARLGRGEKLREERSKAQGDGLGWFSIGQVARELGWRWEFDSEVGKGTTVRIKLNESNFAPLGIEASAVARERSNADPVSAEKIIESSSVFMRAKPFEGYERRANDWIWIAGSPIFHAVEQARDLASRI